MINAQLVSKGHAETETSMASAFTGGGCIAPDEERLVLLKPVVHLSFAYGVLSGLKYNYLTFISSLFIYCNTYLCVTGEILRRKVNKISVGSLC